MTGRLSGIGSSSFSVDQPVPYTEDMFARSQVMDLLTNETLREECLRWSLDEPENENCDSFWLKDVETNQGLQFYLLLDLTHIVHIAISELFSPKGFQDTKSYIERRVRFYDERLDHWLSHLPSAFRFIDESCNLDLNTSSQEQAVLALHYYSARITLYRPCSPFRRYVGLKDEEKADISQRCLQAALSLIAVFPDVTDLDWVYNMFPWWCMHHFLIQASTILVIFTQGNNPAGSVRMKDVEYSFAVSGVAAQVRAACQKAHRWLHDLSRADESCRRAFLLYDDILRRVGFVGSSCSTSMYGSAQSNPLSQNQNGRTNSQHGCGQSTYIVQHHNEYPRPMTLDSSTEWYNHPMSDSGDVPLCVDRRNIDPSIDEIFDLACMKDVFGGTEWIGRALDVQNVCQNST